MKNAGNKDQKIAEKVSVILLDINAVSLNPKKPFRYTSGILSPVYTDCRILISRPKERKLIINLFLEKIKATGVKLDLIAGTATAGIPHAAWIADRLKLPMVYVRSQAKEHGKENQIEGVVKKGQKAVVIEDLISTGGSSVETVRAIRKAGGQASDIFSIITYGMKKSKENFKKNKIRFFSLTTFKQTVAVAGKKRLISPEEEKSILDWTSDPPSWGKRMGFE